MPIRRKPETNLYFTDLSVGVFETHAARRGVTEVHGHLALEKGILENGYVADPVLFVERLKSLFKSHGLRPRRVRLVLNSQNVVMRVLEADRTAIGEEGIAAHFDRELGKSLHFPFPEPKASYHLLDQDEKTVRVLAIASDDRLLNDYLDVFDRLGIRSVAFDMPSLCLYSLYAESAGEHFQNVMLVTVYESYFTIKIFEDDIPAFNLVEEFEGDYERRYEKIDNHVERVANYYRYNMRKGDRRIENVLLVNLSEQGDDDRFAVAFAPKPFGIPYRVFRFPEALSRARGWTRASLIAYAAAVPKTGRLAELGEFDFRLDRPQRAARLMRQAVVLAFLIFSAVSLVYIPYHQKNEEIYILENVNQNLEAQLSDLEAELALLPSFNTRERAYSDAYDTLVAAEPAIARMLADLVDATADGVAIVALAYDAETRAIEVRLEGGSIAELTEFLLAFHEAHATMPDSEDPSRWIAAFPVYQAVGETMIEVIFLHA